MSRVRGLICSVTAGPACFSNLSRPDTYNGP
jgi:hypothetical protein